MAHQDFGVVILAAGLGTRMKSRQAKVLHQAGGESLIGLVVQTALRLVAPERIYVVVGYQADLVRKALDGRGVQFLDQPQQLGTGHAVLVGRQALEKAAPRLLVLYGDCPLVEAETLEGLMHCHRETGAAATVLTTRLEDPAGYGRLLRDSGGSIRAIVEEKAATPGEREIREINSGIYCFDTDHLFQCLPQIRPDNPAGEYYLTDVIGWLVERGLSVAGVEVQEASQVLGINTRVELAQVDARLRERKVRQLMLAGVTIHKPETVTIDDAVSVGPDTVIEPFAQLLGRCSIGSGCRIRSCSIVSDSQLADEVTVEPFSFIHESRLETGVRIGPYARLRTGNHIGPGAKVGNFVELKKTRLGARSKALHLAYLGDSTIGADVNIGAGTITCNYDGTHKHSTVIEDGAFVGTNSTLVAPLKIGAGAYVAAGSVVTEEVPPEALGIARSRQTNKPGWATRRRGREKVPDGGETPA